MNSPFKFLDAYTPADRDLFFGREEEVAALYDMVTKNRLILVYGQSGTGKTSLIQCGLASRFDVTDWYPLFFIRRQNNLNQSLREQLLAITGGDSLPSVPQALEDIYFNHLRPVYLIFDQLEELLILGTAEEQELFIQTIRAILDSGVPCRILFVIREEYLAYLYAFEQTIPTLFDRRLRVEPMSVPKARTVLEKSFQHFNIRAGQPADETLLHIIGNVSGGKAGIQLPYLQVYLDTLYRQEFARRHPGQENPPGEWLPLEFSRADVDALGQIENVLERFLEDRRAAIQHTLQQQFPEIDPDAVRKVLDAFVTEEGTKRPMGFQRKGPALHIEALWANLFHPLPPEALGTCCALLEQARLLRFSDTHIELAHDALAGLIDQQRSGQQRRLQEAMTRLLNNYREYRDTGEYLTRKQLNYLEDLWPLLEPRLDAAMIRFVRESEQQARQTEQIELEAERHKRKMARRAALVGFSLAVAALIGFAVAWVQYRAANRAKIDIARNALQAQRNSATALKVEGKYTEALQQLAATDQFVSVLKAEERNELAQLRLHWEQVIHFMNAGDSLFRTGDLRQALQQYEQAQQAGTDARIDERVKQTRVDLENAYRQNMLSGEALYNARRYEQAAAYYEKALQLKPGDALATQKLKQVKAH